MNPKSVVESVKEKVGQARSTVGMVAAHGQDAIKAGAQTAREAKNVVVEAGREIAEVASRRKEELKQTLKDGASQIGGKLSRLTTPTRKEQAALRKAEVKAKKQQKRAESSDDAAPQQASA